MIKSHKNGVHSAFVFNAILHWYSYTLFALYVSSILRLLLLYDGNSIEQKSHFYSCYSRHNMRMYTHTRASSCSEAPNTEILITTKATKASDPLREHLEDGEDDFTHISCVRILYIRAKNSAQCIKRYRTVSMRQLHKKKLFLETGENWVTLRFVHSCWNYFIVCALPVLACALHLSV